MSNILFADGDVRVTKAVLEVGSTQFQIRQITSTEISTLKPNPWPAVLAALVVGFAPMVYHGLMIFLGLLTMPLAYKLIAQRLKPKHTLKLVVSSGCVTALTRTDYDFVVRVRDALQRAQEGLAA